MTDLYLVEPEPSPKWFPFSQCRPICELRAGAWLIRERWEAIADGSTAAIFGHSGISAFVEEGVPRIETHHGIDGPAIVGYSEFVPAGEQPTFPAEMCRLTNDGSTVGWWIPEGNKWDGGQPAGSELELEGMTLAGAYDLITALELLLPPDTMDFTYEGGDPLPEGSVVIGDPADVVILGAVVEPGTIFDVRQGVVVVEQHAYLNAGTRLEGPVYIGPGTEILGGPVKGCAVGPRCRIRGEITNTVVLGYANKGHDGFVGHSVIGRWVNIGAGTTTSNLKNTYGPVRLDIAGDKLDTGRQFLGTLFGDHVKVAIGTQLGTGTVIGPGANVFGTPTPPKYIAPFAWGPGGESMERDGFLKIARRVMPRRHVEVTAEVQAALEALYDNAMQH
ncbi:MAG: hypothetical protein ACE5HT_07835 [Gemmatimonadales bacterium]